MKTIFALVAVLSAEIAFAQPARPASATLQGIVFKWGTSEPVAKAKVELRRVDAGAPAPRVATTAGDGVFRFENVPPGQYFVVAARSGFVNGEYGKRWPNGVGLPLTVAAGQGVGNIQIAMAATAAVSGRIRDRFGQPVGNVEVQALKATYQDGRRVLTRVSSVQSDDRGEYRLFWLPPGRYYLRARHPDIGGGLMRFGGFRLGPGVGPNGPVGFDEFRSGGDLSAAAPIDRERQRAERDRYLPVYFPGGIDEQSASPIDLAAGTDLPSTDFTIDPVPVQRVRGRVVYEANGEAAMSAKIQWLSSSGASSGDQREGLFPIGGDAGASPECCDGAFELGLAPGSYTLIGAVSNLSGRVGVQVGYGDVDGVVLPISQGFNLTGRMTFEGQTPGAADLAALRISLAMDPLVPGLAPTSYSVVLPSGALTLSAGRGDFRVSIAPLLNIQGAYRSPVRAAVPSSLQHAYVKSIRLGNADVLNGGLHLDRQPDAPLEIVIGTTPGALEGVVVNDSREPVPNVTVALVPDAARRARFDLYRSATSDAAGRFRIPDVPPGDYTALAFDGVESGEWQSAEFVAPYEGRGKPVRVVDGASAGIELIALPPAR